MSRNRGIATVWSCVRELSTVQQHLRDRRARDVSITRRVWTTPFSTEISMSKVDLKTLLNQLVANDNTKPTPGTALTPKPAPVKPPSPPRMNRALRPRRRT
jgi:hypothetical protein